MPTPFDQLEPEDQERVLTEIRAILREPDRRAAARMRRTLAAALRGRYPDVAAWVEEDVAAARGRGEHPVLAELDVDDARVEALRDEVVVVKYGGNAMVDEVLKQSVVADICLLKELGAVPVVVHGGGPVISRLLAEVGLESRFVGGHRKTDRRVMEYVEMALSGRVNSEIVKLVGLHGVRSAGISGKDGGLVTATKRIHEERRGETVARADLGQVGDVAAVDPDLVRTLVDGGYVPVIAPIGVGEDLVDYNINADMFAGHMAAALEAAAFVALTDVDGLFLDKDDPATLIPEISARAARSEMGRIIQGGMIPKVEAGLVALAGGVPRAHIVNGTAAHALLRVLVTGEPCGTTLTGEDRAQEE